MDPKGVKNLLIILVIGILLVSYFFYWIEFGSPVSQYLAVNQAEYFLDKTYGIQIASPKVDFSITTYRDHNHYSVEGVIVNPLSLQDRKIEVYLKNFWDRSSHFTYFFTSKWETEAASEIYPVYESLFTAQNKFRVSVKDSDYFIANAKKLVNASYSDIKEQCELSITTEKDEVTEPEFDNFIKRQYQFISLLKADSHRVFRYIINVTAIRDDGSRSQTVINLNSDEISDIKSIEDVSELFSKLKDEFK